MYRIVKIFNNIEIKGLRAGRLATYIWLSGCNLKCNQCTIKKSSFPYQGLELELEGIINSIDYANVTIIGGEPLIHPGIENLIKAILDKGYFLNVETNGSIALLPYMTIKADVIRNTCIFTVNYRCPSTGMQHKMWNLNLELLRPVDVIRFTVYDMDDVNFVRELLHKNSTKAVKHIVPAKLGVSVQELNDYMLDYQLEDWCLHIPIL